MREIFFVVLSVIFLLIAICWLQSYNGDKDLLKLVSGDQTINIEKIIIARHRGNEGLAVTDPKLLKHISLELSKGLKTNMYVVGSKFNAYIIFSPMSKADILFCGLSETKNELVFCYEHSIDLYSLYSVAINDRTPSTIMNVVNFLNKP